MTALEVIREIRSFGVGTFDVIEGREFISWQALGDLLDRLEQRAQEDKAGGSRSNVRTWTSTSGIWRRGSPRGRTARSGRRRSRGCSAP